MGLLDVLGGFVQNKVNERDDRINKIRARYESGDNEYLIRKFKSTTGEEKMAIGLILKDRGYSSS
ncbi:MAG: hypothetical protein Q8N30_14325 [Methylococcales bacterium]|nr:hypothetical protein [Methylococcales bacterium]